MPRRASESSAVLAGLLASSEAAESPRRTSMGLVTYCFENAKRNRARIPAVPDFTDPKVFIVEAARLGAAAVQIPFGVREADSIRAIRETAENNRVTLESTVSLPRTDTDLERVEAELRTIRELGITIVRTVLLPGRRYEQFKTMEEYRAALQRGTKVLVAAERVARRLGVKLALENHKDQRTEERIKLLEEFGGEHLGACLDLGNNIALLEDPLEVARAFAPWTLTVHFKDQGVREYEDGFLLADIAAGRGAMQLEQIVKEVRAKKPKALFHLELITRDPLKVPVFKDQYWATLGEIKASQLATALAAVSGAAPVHEFPMVSTLAPADQVALERSNVEQSLRYAADKLGFSV